ncbi:interleukin-10 isoform X1 [Cricetulus griseus]|uniref:Interleukin family protein n=1 Tax=Cricetulus griseus TaxID=10029 RepID=A0A9J7G3A0_CRIGR|nr:interleukin-10 isoform X1 [Cricetulus griseus]XP_027291559.1 interleukin-10 isoform X1 [Cricetulus griseus]
MPVSALLCCLLLLAGVGPSRGQYTQQENNCTHFPVSQTHMLRELRTAFSQVKTFFQKKDQLDNILLTDSLVQDFEGYLGCQTLSEMIQFYLVEVMPQAENHGPEIKEHLNSLGEKLKTLRRQLQRCVSSRPLLSLGATQQIPFSTAQPGHIHPETHRLDWGLGKSTPAPPVRSLAHLSLGESGGGFETLTREDLRIVFLLFVSHCGLLATPLSSWEGQGFSYSSLKSLWTWAPGCQLRLPSRRRNSPLCLIFWEVNSVTHNWVDRILPGISEGPEDYCP